MKGLLFDSKLDAGILVLRVLLGVVMAYHGYAKFLGGEAGLTAVGSSMKLLGFTSGFYTWGLIAACVEVVFGLSIALGFNTRIACIMIMGTLVVATILKFSHAKSYLDYSYPLEMIYVYFGIFVSGAGKYSLDAKFSAKK